ACRGRAGRRARARRRVRRGLCDRRPGAALKRRRPGPHHRRHGLHRPARSRPARAAARHLGARAWLLAAHACDAEGGAVTAALHARRRAPPLPRLGDGAVGEHAGPVPIDVQRARARGRRRGGPARAVAGRRARPLHRGHPVTAAAAIAAWVGGSLILLSDGRRGLALGLAVLGGGLAGLALDAGHAFAAVALAAGGAGAGALRLREGADGWGIMPPGSTPRLILATVSALIALYLAAVITEGPGAGFRFAVPAVIA